MSGSPSSHLLISRMASGEPEIFASIQGEGLSAGRPSTFVRLAVCNLQCGWCDTAYTWDWKRFDRTEQTVLLAPQEIDARVRRLAPRNVVITGGEPLIQRRQLVAVAGALRVDGYRVEIETNGTIAPGPLAEFVDQFNVSPKLSHSGNPGLRRIEPRALAWFAACERASFKFVVESERDLDEVESLRAQFTIPADRILLMPQARTADELAVQSPKLAEVCTARGYRFSTRLHILIWGDKRGV